MGVIGGERKRFGVSVVGFDPVISGPLLPDGVRRTHGCREYFTHRVEPRCSCQNRHSQLVSTKALLEVKRRMTRRICAPQVGHQATSAGGGMLRVGLHSMGRACKMIRRRVSGGMAPLACRKPK
jgi:hypothetical protein